MEYLSFPKEYEIVYLNSEQDPNRFGETLRYWAFVGSGGQVGCYETFQTNKFLKEITTGKIYNEAKKILCPEFEDTIHVYHSQVKEKDCYIKGDIGRYKTCEPYEIVVAWLWSGDGHLYFRYNDRKVENTDCKCDYTWNWC